MTMRSRAEAMISSCVTVHPHETSVLLHSSSCFFFILSAYFVVLPLRDEGAISLGLGNLPELVVGSLALTLLAAPVSTFIFSLPTLSKGKALVLIHRSFSLSLVVFYILWKSSSPGYLPPGSKDSVSISTAGKDSNLVANQESDGQFVVRAHHGWFYISVRIAFFLWVALLNLITISSTWARVIDVMNSESGSRLFGFIGAGATFGQLLGSLFASGMAWLGPNLLLVAAALMELAAQSSKGISQDKVHVPEEFSLNRKDNPDRQNKGDDQSGRAPEGRSPRASASSAKLPVWALLDGLRLILSSTYLLYVSLFLWLSAVISSFFYFQKVTIIAMTVTTPLGRRRLFAQINSFIAVFILAGQLTLKGRILTIAGVTTAICASPFVAFSNLVALAVWPTWVAVAVTETLRKVVTYVVTRPGRELLFTVVSQDEKYKAKVCLVWICTAVHLGGRQSQLAKLQTASNT